MGPKCVICNEKMDYDHEKKEYVCWVCDKVFSTAYQSSVEEQLAAAETRGAADERARIVGKLETRKTEWAANAKEHPAYELHVQEFIDEIDHLIIVINEQ